MVKGNEISNEAKRKTSIARKLILGIALPEARLRVSGEEEKKKRGRTLVLPLVDLKLTELAVRRVCQTWSGDRTNQP